MRSRMQVRIYKPKWRVMPERFLELEDEFKIVKTREIIYYEGQEVQEAAATNCNDEKQNQLEAAAAN